MNNAPDNWHIWFQEVEKLMVRKRRIIGTNWESESLVRDLGVAFEAGWTPEQACDAIKVEAK